MAAFTFDIDEETAKALNEAAKELCLTTEALTILAISSVVKNTEGSNNFGFAPANEHMTRLVADFTQSPPSTPEEVRNFADRLAYFAQFATTNEVPDYRPS